MNWVFDSMRKSLKTLWRRQSAAFVSLISPSTCFLISCVLEMVCCENSCRKRSSCRGQGKAALGAAPSAPQRHSRLRSRPHRHAHAWPRPRPRPRPPAPALTPASEAKDQLWLPLRISSSDQGRSHTAAGSAASRAPFIICGRRAVSRGAEGGRGRHLQPPRRSP